MSQSRTPPNGTRPNSVQIDTVENEWEALLREKGVVALSEGLRSYWTALGITSALIGAMGFSGALVPIEMSSAFDITPEDNWADDTVYKFACCYYVLIMTSTVMAILSVIWVTGFYNQFTTMTASDESVQWFLKTWRWTMGLPDLFLLGSVALFLLACVFAGLIMLPRVVGIALISVGLPMEILVGLYYAKFSAVNGIKRINITGTNNGGRNTVSQNDFTCVDSSRMLLGLFLGSPTLFLRTKNSNPDDSEWVS